MKKYLALILIAITLFFTVSSLSKIEAKEEYDYKYKVIANSNSIDDLVELYETKEILVISYNNAIENDLLIEDVYHSFSNENIVLEGNTFVIRLGNAKGISLEGKLKTNACDTSTINNRYALLEWLSNLK